MKLRELFSSDVTRDIPPVVYFHEQSAQKLAEEVSEYIVTGGFPDDHPHKKRVPNGIHEQYVKLLRAMATELEKRGGPELPASWISGFYGSGKSSFAKLLGLALDGVALPDGSSLAEALLSRDTSPRASELREAYGELRTKIDPLSVVFDLGGVARDDEQIHSAVVRQVQRRLGYCHDPYVAEMELRLERDNQWEAFEQAAERVLERPWTSAKGEALADDQFSQAMHALFPDRYTDPMAWIAARAGSHSYTASVEEATRAIRDMLEHRAKGKTLFVVIDEVSQYVHQDEGRMLKLQSFVSDLGQRLKGRVWLLVTGQEKLEEGGDQNVLGKMKDRFPEKLRVHLAATNIRDVVHKRLLTKKSSALPTLREHFQKHRNDLKLFAYECEDISEDDFVEVYPLLPGHIDLVLQITSALRTRSSRSQGDDQAIRGLLQLLGELFRSQKLADAELGALVTLDQVYEVQHTALDSDVQASMARVLKHCADHDLGLAARAAKAVALLELIQETLPTDAKLVASCLYHRLDLGSHQEAVTEALEELRRHSLLGYSEKHGYKVQSSSGEEWVRERSDIPVPREQLSEAVQEALKYLVTIPEKPRMKGQAFPWRVFFSDGRGSDDVHLTSGRDPAAVKIDLRLLGRGDRDPETWVPRSAESSFHDRLLWLVGDAEDLESTAREFCKSNAMVRRYKARRESLGRDKQRLLLEEEAHFEDLEKKLQRAVDAAFVSGELYFRGKRSPARDEGDTFAKVLATATERVLPELFPSFVPTRVTDAEVLQLIEETLNAPSPKFVQELGILSLDAGRYEPSCEGVVPRGIVEHIEAENGIGGARLLEHFGGPPYGYAPEVVRACVAGLLRAHRVRIQPEGGQELTSARDAGVRDVFEKDRGFKRANVFPAGSEGIKPKDRARICKFFEKHLALPLDREADAIADAVAKRFPDQAGRLREVFERLRRLPGDVPVPYVLSSLDDALTRCVSKSRYTEPTVRECLKQLDALNDGFGTLALFHAELTDEAVQAVRCAHDVAHHQGAQLKALGGMDETVAGALEALEAQLASDRPWQDIAAAEPHQRALREHYAERRKQLLRSQEKAAEAARAEIKGRQGFAMLTADQSHHVLRPITDALSQTDADALQPTLVALRDGYQGALERAVEEANDRLDAILSEGDKPVIRKLSVNLHNREIASEEELERVLDELRTRILEQLAHGRVRLL